MNWECCNPATCRVERTSLHSPRPTPVALPWSRSALDCSRLAAVAGIPVAGDLRSRDRVWLALAATHARRHPAPRVVGGGAWRGDVDAIEAGAGPLSGTDGGHRGWRASEPAAGPAGRCHVMVSSGPGDCGLGVSALRVVSRWSRSFLLSLPLPRGGAAQRPPAHHPPRSRPGALHPPGRVRPRGAGHPPASAPGSPARRVEVWLPRTHARGG